MGTRTALGCSVLQGVFLAPTVRLLHGDFSETGLGQKTGPPFAHRSCTDVHLPRRCKRLEGTRSGRQIVGRT